LGSRRRDAAFGTANKIADIPNKTLGELAGRADAADDETRIENAACSIKKVDRLPGEDQKALLVVLDSPVKRSPMDKATVE